MQSLVAALLLVAAGSALSAYPYYKGVVRNPRDYDQLYSSASGPINESWYFDYKVTLTSVIIPSQISEPFTDGTYEEAIDVFLYESRAVFYWMDPETHVVATGSFSGPASFGQALDIPLWNATIKGPPKIQRYINSYSGFFYTLSIVFNKTGTYPWYTDRKFSFFTPLLLFTNGAGMAIGLTNTDS